MRSKLRNRIRRVIFGGGASVALSVVASVAPASATRCLYPGDAAIGGVRSDIQSAWASARGNWERAIAKRHGRRFADWSYAADGRIDCSWNDRGNRIRCVARAAACAE